MTKRILIVDDERPVGTLLEHTLDDMQDADVELIVVECASEAMDICREVRPDLAFVDADLANREGVSLRAWLLDTFASDPPTVVLLVDKGRIPAVEQNDQPDAIEYVEKPFDPDTIRALACEVLGFEFEG